MFLTVRILVLFFVLKKIYFFARTWAIKAGITEAADHLPDFFSDEPVAPHNTTFDFTPEELQTTFNWIKK